MHHKSILITFSIFLTALLLSACGSATPAVTPTATIVEVIPTPTPVVISEILPRGEGGAGTRVLITEQDGSLVVNPAGSGAGYRYEIASEFITSMEGSLIYSLVPGPFEPSYWYADAQHVYGGKVSFSGYAFESDPYYPLTFKLVRNVGLVYLCGRGSLTTQSGEVYDLGFEDTIDTWIPLVNALEPVHRERAIQALGWLAKTDSEKEIVLPILLNALSDSSMPVRRNAAEALGRIGSVDAIEALTLLADEQTETDAWVRAVALEALAKLK